MEKMKISNWAKPFAVGLLACVIDFPYDVVGAKLLWWTWHDTDPNIAERSYWVPWTSYVFHASFAFGFTLLFLATQRIFVSGKNEKSFLPNVLSVAITGLFAMPLGVIQLILTYHSLHDLLKLDAEVCVCLILSAYLTIFWISNYKQSEPTTPAAVIPSGFLPLFAVLLFLSYQLVAVWIAVPERIINYGLHETIGPCKEKFTSFNAFGQIVEKRKFLCVEDYSEPFDFRCVDKLPKKGSKWYTICGTPFENRAEYLVMITLACACGITIFWSVLKNTGLQQLPSKLKTSKTPNKEITSQDKNKKGNNGSIKKDNTEDAINKSKNKSTTSKKNVIDKKNK